MIEYQNYGNHLDYHQSMIDSNLHNEATYNQFGNNSINSDNLFDNIATNSISTEFNVGELFNDTLLSDYELDFIKEIFDDNSFVTSVSSNDNSSIIGISNVDSTKHKQRNQSRFAFDKIITTYRQQQERTLQIMKKNFEEFQQIIHSCALSNNTEELSLRIHQSLHPKCLVRFKLTNVSAKSGPKSLLDYLGLMRKAFPDGRKTFFKDKIFASDGYYIYKRKFVFNGTESSFEDTYNFFSYCCDIKDILYLNDRKDNFVPSKYNFKINVTRYVDPLTFKVVLCDIGLNIVSQNSIK